MNIVSVIIGGLIIGYCIPDFIRILSPKDVDPIPLFYRLLFAWVCIFNGWYISMKKILSSIYRSIKRISIAIIGALYGPESHSKNRYG